MIGTIQQNEGLKMKYCSECAAGEFKVEAEFLATGHDGERPFKKLVCDDHAEMLAQDYDANIRPLPNEG